MATTTDLQNAIDALNAARISAQSLLAVEPLSNVSSAQLVAAAAAIAAATTNVNNIITALNNDPGLVDARAAAAARVALTPAIKGAVTLIASATQQVGQFRSEGVR
jgi:hypothetical protein